MKNESELYNNLQAIEEALQEEKIRNFYSKIFSLNCTNRTPVPRDLRARQDLIWKPGDLEKTLTLMFDHSPDPKQPFSITYCTGVLEKPTYTGVHFGIPNIIGPRPLQKPCQLHESIIMGRRYNKGRCELLLKNSWGSDVDEFLYSKEYKVEGGKIWIPLDALSRNTIRATHLD